MDYQRLDDILKFLYKYSGYCGWTTYRDSSKYQNEKITDNLYIKNCSILQNFGLVENHKIGVIKINHFIITYKGIDLINSGKSTSDFHNELIKKEILEEKILETTLESHELSKLSTEIAKQSTRLNKRQLLVTGILGGVSIFSIIFQCESNKIAQRNLELVEKTYQLELKNKEINDTIIVRLENTKKTIK